MKTIQANLVFCPFTLPALPLGIAVIKAAVQKNSDLQAKCFDLNTHWQNLLVDTVKQGKTNIMLKDQLAFLEAAEMFQTGSANFYNQAQYDRLALAFHEDFEMLNNTFARQCEQVLDDREEVPWYIHKYKVMAYFSANFFGYFSTYSRTLGIFRDHALLIYGHPEKTIFNIPQKTVPQPSLNLNDS